MCHPCFQLAVLLDTDGAGDIVNQKVEDGKLAAKPEDPAKTGYTFGGVAAVGARLTLAFFSIILYF